jgi:hypothetical protein
MLRTGECHQVLRVVVVPVLVDVVDVPARGDRPVVVLPDLPVQGSPVTVDVVAPGPVEGLPVVDHLVCHEQKTKSSEGVLAG